jgi:hypothetical protein
MERAIRFTKEGGRLGMIVPTSVVGLSENAGLRNSFQRLGGKTWMSTYGIRPAKLFDGVDQRLCIYIATSSKQADFELQATQFIHWNSAERDHLFSRLVYASSKNHARFDRFIQAGDPRLLKILESIELKSAKTCSSLKAHRKSDHVLQYHRSPRYWIRGMDFAPIFESATRTRSIHHIRDIAVADESGLFVLGAILNSALFFIWFISIGNGRNITSEDIDEFPVGMMDASLVGKAKTVFRKLMADYKKNSEIRVRTDCRFQEFRPSKSKPIIDEIDTILASHYGFTPEELDFIINYDIKYRMGLGGGSAEEDEE